MTTSRVMSAALPGRVNRLWWANTHASRSHSCGGVHRVDRASVGSDLFGCHAPNLSPSATWNRGRGSGDRCHRVRVHTLDAQAVDAAPDTRADSMWGGA